MTAEELKHHMKALDNRYAWLALKCAGLKSGDYGPLLAEKEATKVALDLMAEKVKALNVPG